MSFNAPVYGADDMWSDAAGETEKAQHEAGMAYAMARTASLTDVLYGASSEADLDNRLALITPKLAAIAEESGVDAQELTSTHRRQALLAVEAASWGHQSDDHQARHATRKQAGAGGEMWNPAHPDFHKNDSGVNGEVLGHLQDYLDALNSQPGEGRSGATYESSRGNKYTKVIKHNTFDGNPVSNSGSAHAFVDHQTGQVYKPAGWNKPAPGARFDLTDPESKARLLEHASSPQGYSGGYLYRHGSITPLGRIAAIKQALEDGQNPLAWIPSTDGGQGQAEQPSMSGNEAFLEGDYVTPDGDDTNPGIDQAAQVTASAPKA